MTAEKWKRKYPSGFEGNRVLQDCIADLTTAEELNEWYGRRCNWYNGQLEALKARLEEARWLLEHIMDPKERDADYLRRYDVWLKEGGK